MNEPQRRPTRGRTDSGPLKELVEYIARSLTHDPLQVRVSALVPHAAEPGHVWLSLDEARGAAIPAPVKRILAQLNASDR